MEPYHRLIGFINEFRKSVLYLLGAVAIGTLGYYFITPEIFDHIQHHLHQRLAFFTVAEPFLAHVKLAFFLTLFTLMPWITFTIWKALAKPFSLTKSQLWAFTLFTCFLFYGGAMFCYFLTLPFGINFLLGFESEQLKPIISIARFVNFVTIFILAFGIIFELPVFMIFSARSSLITRATFVKQRRYAILIFSIVAAMFTPTPDVVNMMLMGVPLYMLYEAGILILKILKIP